MLKKVVASLIITGLISSIVIGLCGCATEDDGWNYTGSSTHSADTELTTDTDTDTDSESESESTTESINLDFPNDTGFDPDDPVTSCKKVDFLFVIDNSGSMGDNQELLIANFDVFVDGIKETITELESIHVGVVTTDSYMKNALECRQLGALVTESIGGVCGPYAEGYNYMTAQDDLPAAFTCAANLGSQGSSFEQQIEAAVQALEGYMNSPGQCNDGFSREDAFTVITIITDEDMAYAYDGAAAHDHLVWLKKDETNMALLLLVIGPEPNNCPSGYPPAFLLAFADMFTYGFVGDLCATDYSSFFELAVDTIDSACEEIPHHPPVP